MQNNKKLREKQTKVTSKNNKSKYKYQDLYLLFSNL